MRSLIMAFVIFAGAISFPADATRQHLIAGRGPAVPDGDSASPAVLPFDLVGNAIILHVRLNGRGPFAMLLDSGAVNFLAPDVAQQLGLTITGSDKGLGVGKRTVVAGDTQIQSADIGGLHLRSMPFHVVQLPYVMEHGFPEPVVGGLGYELLNRIALRIDFDRRQLSVWNGATFRYHGKGSFVQIAMQGHVPVARGAVDGTPGIFEIDLGAEDSLSLNTPFVSRNEIIRKYSARIYGFAGEGVGGRENAYFVRVHKFDLGGVSVSSIITELSQDTAGATSESNSAGIVGMGVLRRFNIVLDYCDQRLYLEPNSNYKHPSVFNRAGFAPRITSSGLIVVSVFQNSPATEAGIAPGDQILSINGNRGSDLDVPFLFKVLRQRPGTVLQLEILRNGVSRHIQVKLRNLL